LVIDFIKLSHDVVPLLPALHGRQLRPHRRSHFIVRSANTGPLYRRNVVDEIVLRCTSIRFGHRFLIPIEAGP
jgi:hypothetical protein